jgi:hypothetical protein
MICDILSDSKFKTPLPGAIQLMRSANSAFTMAGPNAHRPDYSPFEGEDGPGPMSPLSGGEKRKYEDILSDDCEGKSRGISISLISGCIFIAILFQNRKLRWLL